MVLEGREVLVFWGCLKFWSLNRVAIERRFCLATIGCCAISNEGCGVMCKAPWGIKCDVIGCPTVQGTMAVAIHCTIQAVSGCQGAAGFMGSGGTVVDRFFVS